MEGGKRLSLRAIPSSSQEGSAAVCVSLYQAPTHVALLLASRVCSFVHDDGQTFVPASHFPHSQHGRVPTVAAHSEFKLVFQ